MKGMLYLVYLLLGPPPPIPGDESPSQAVDEGPLFVEASRRLGVDFVHENGMTGELYMPETVGSGSALFDYDGDGDLDLYLVQGGPLQAASPPQRALPMDRLYRNDLGAAEAGRRLAFTDVTAESGIRSRSYGMGVATGDFDNDGDVDLYVTNFGPNQLWRNNGDGTFRDVTGPSGTADGSWSVSATFFDYDDDGWLDLYVANYVRFTFALHKVCRTASGAPDYCGPSAYEPLRDRLFHNRGDGTFENVTLEAGIAGVNRPAGAGLGVVALDLNGDDRRDLYVANDGMANFLWLNQGDGTFRDEALLAGVAVNAQGHPEASMGLDAGDFDGDGDLDLFLAHLTGETHTLYTNLGDGLFEDRTPRSGLGPASRWATGFGTGWLDFDNDGCLDLVVANGAIKTVEALVRRGDPYPLHQTNQLFRNACDGTFEDTTHLGGPGFELSEVSRGLSLGDLDNDGDEDLVLVNNHGPVRVLLNQWGHRRHWLGVRAVGGRPPRDLPGTQVLLLRNGRATLLRRVSSDGSYASAADPRVLFGLGSDPQVDALVVRWPDGELSEWRSPGVDRYLTLSRDGDEPPSPRP